MIIRGPSGAGKSSVADAVRRRHGRGLAVLGQDVMRRTLLWEKKDLAGGLAPGFITHSAGFLLNAGWPVIIEGILSVTFYGSALRELIAAHRGRTLVYFLQVELVETFTRHATRPEAAEFSTADMASWYLLTELTLPLLQVRAYFCYVSAPCVILSTEGTCRLSWCQMPAAWWR
ncbi:MAG TPA: AAA family ATPase, partial [Pseudonocardiaceae bacterium]